MGAEIVGRSLTHGYTEGRRPTAGSQPDARSRGRVGWQSRTGPVAALAEGLAGDDRGESRAWNKLNEHSESSARSLTEPLQTSSERLEGVSGRSAAAALRRR